MNPDDADQVKAIRKEHTLLNWFNKSFLLESGYVVVRPLRLYDDCNALVTKETEGTVLDLITKKMVQDSIVPQMTFWLFADAVGNGLENFNH